MNWIESNVRYTKDWKWHEIECERKKNIETNEKKWNELASQPKQ